MSGARSGYLIVGCDGRPSDNFGLRGETTYRRLQSYAARNKSSPFDIWTQSLKAKTIEAAVKSGGDQQSLRPKDLRKIAGQPSLRVNLSRFHLAFRETPLPDLPYMINPKAREKTYREHMIWRAWLGSLFLVDDKWEVIHRNSEFSPRWIDQLPNAHEFELYVYFIDDFFGDYDGGQPMVGVAFGFVKDSKVCEFILSNVVRGEMRNSTR